jgi:Protein of unknown function (DUF3467)
MEEIKKPEVQIEIDDATAQGAYSNLAMIAHSDSEFILDFIFVQPQAARAKVRARVLTSPSHAKRLLAALKDNISKYEAKFGEIKAGVQTEQEKKIGFYH